MAGPAADGLEMGLGQRIMFYNHIKNSNSNSNTTAAALQQQVVFRTIFDNLLVVSKQIELYIYVCAYVYACMLFFLLRLHSLPASLALCNVRSI